jgi:hypothetical protein
MEREERKTQVGWGDLESERILEYLSMGRTMLLPARGRQSERLWMDQSTVHVMMVDG